MGSQEKFRDALSYHFLKYALSQSISPAMRTDTGLNTRGPVPLGNFLEVFLAFTLNSTILRRLWFIVRSEHRKMISKG